MPQRLSPNTLLATQTVFSLASPSTPCFSVLHCPHGHRTHSWTVSSPRRSQGFWLSRRDREGRCCSLGGSELDPGALGLRPQTSWKATWPTTLMGTRGFGFPNELVTFTAYQEADYCGQSRPGSQSARLQIPALQFTNCVCGVRVSWVVGSKEANSSAHLP